MRNFLKYFMEAQSDGHKRQMENMLLIWYGVNLSSEPCTEMRYPQCPYMMDTQTVLLLHCCQSSTFDEIHCWYNSLCIWFYYSNPARCHDANFVVTNDTGHCGRFSVIITGALLICVLDFTTDFWVMAFPLISVTEGDNGKYRHIQQQRQTDGRYTERERESNNRQGQTKTTK